MSTTLESLKSGLGEDLKDLRLNLGGVLQNGSLDESQRWAVAYTSALFLRDTVLVESIAEEAGERLTPEIASDARAAAAIMAMNTVYYRFRHMVGKESYGQKPAGLRMTRMGRPATSKAVFELCSLACAALAGCELCIQSHEASLRHEGVTEDQVHDAVRIAAVINGFRTAVFAGAMAGSGV